MRDEDLTMKSIYAAPFVIAAAAALRFLAACSSDNDATAVPSRVVTPPPAGTAQPDGGDVPGADGGAAACFDVTKAKPVEPSQFLNQCNGTQCFPFDNGARIEGFVPGAPLPSLN